MGFIHWLAGFLSDYGVWATLISVLAGFLGIGATLVIQRRHDIERDSASEERARRRLLVAFRTEMRGIIQHARDATEHLNGDSDFLFPRAAPFPLFDALADKLDLLNEDEIAKVVAVYVWLREIPQRLSALAHGRDAPPDWIAVPRNRLQVIQFLFNRLETLAFEAEATLAKALNV